MDSTWLADGAANQLHYAWDDIVSVRTPAMEMRARLDRLSNSDLAWYENEARTAHDPASAVVGMPIAEPFLYLHVQLEGSGAIALPGARREVITTESTISLRQANVPYGVFEMPAAHTARIFGVVATPETVGAWFGGAVPTGLRPILGGQSEAGGDVPGLSGAYFRMMASRIADYLDPLRRIAAEGIAMQMMTAYLQTLLGRDAISSSLDSREQRAAREARALLLSNLRRPPSTSELATMVGLSERRLDHAFRDLFGASIFRTLSNARLDHAYDALVRGNITVKELAFRLGYAHSASFSHAFRARFGVFPSRVRPG